MSSRSKSKGNSGGGYKPVATVTQGQADRSLSGLMDKQKGIVGTILGTLVDKGQSVMDDNPGLTNFMNNVGTATDKVGDAINTPRSLLDELGETLGFNKEEEPAELPAPNPYGLTPEQLARMQKYGGYPGGYNVGGTGYNINNDMRNRFNRR